MIKNAETMEQRLGGRPRLPEEEKRRAVNLTLSPEALAALDGWQRSTGKTRSELVDNMVRHTAVQPNWPEPPVAPEPLTEAQLQAATSLANHSLNLWVSQQVNSSVDDIAEAADALFQNAVRMIRAHR